MHQSHSYFMLWANQGSWIFQCPITLQSCICQVLWVRQFQVQTFWVREFHAAISCYSSMSLELSIPCFRPNSHNFMSGPWRQHQKFDKGEKWLAATVFFLLSPLPHSYLSHYFLTLVVTRSQSASLCSPFLSSTLSFVLTPTRSLMFSLLIHPSLALGPSFTDNLPRVASIHLSALKLSTPFFTQNPKGWKAKEGDQREREN